MSGQALPRSKALVTTLDGTLEWLFSRVGPQVHSQFGLSGELLQALSTRVLWLCPCYVLSRLRFARGLRPSGTRRSRGGGGGGGVVYAAGATATAVARLEFSLLCLLLQLLLLGLDRRVQCLPVLLVHPAQVSVESRLAMEGLLAATHGTLVAAWLAVDGLDVHEKVVADTEATPTFLAQVGCLLCVALDVPPQLVGCRKSPGATVKRALMFKFRIVAVGWVGVSSAAPAF